MTQAAVQPTFSFEADIDLGAQTDERYALVQGALVKMTPTTWQHMSLARFVEPALNAQSEPLQYAWEAQPEDEHTQIIFRCLSHPINKRLQRARSEVRSDKLSEGKRLY